jgi:hypothetical protein
MNVTLFSTFDSIPAGGLAGPASSGCLVNFYNRPIWIDDIVFDWDWTVPSRGVSQTYGAPLGDTIRASIRWQNHPLTAGFMPVNLLGSARNARAATPAIRAATNVVHTSLVWRLPEPLWLPPNVPLTFQIQHVNDFTVASAAASQTIDVTIRGVLADSDDIPDEVDIPYAASFLTPVETDTSGGTTGVAPPVIAQSGQTDLFNPFEVPLNIERLTYYVGVSSTGLDGATRANFAPTDATSGQDQTGSLTVGQNYGLAQRYVTMKMVSGRGRALIRNYTPIGTVFGPERSWVTKTLLTPADYYTAFISQQMPLFTDPGTLAFQMRTALGMIGTRRITLRDAIKTY